MQNIVIIAGRGAERIVKCGSGVSMYYDDI
jgi:hypothetical protein